MKRKLALLISILLLLGCLFTLVGCTYESYDFTALAGDTSGTVSSNGGLAVQKGQYIYYINAVAPTTNDNIFGNVEYGSIYRIKKTEFDAIIEEHAAPKSYIFAASELVVPKIVYTANTTDKTLNGMFIFGDRIYYTSPDTTPDKNGKPQSSRLTLLSCNLDGTGTVAHLTVASNSTQICISEVAGKVYAMYVVNKELFCADLTAKTDAVKICEDAQSFMFERNNGVAYYINADNDICGYKAGDAESKILYKNTYTEGNSLTKTSYSLKYVDALGNLYFIVGGTVINDDGIYMVSMSANARRISYFQPSVYFCYNGYVYSVSADSGSKNLVRYNPVTDKYDILGILSVTPSRWLSFDGTTLYYCDSSSLYRLDVTKNAQTASDTLATRQPASAWGDFDFCAGYLFVFSSTANGTLYPVAIIVEDEDKRNEVVLMHIPGEKDEEEEGDE